MNALLKPSSRLSRIFTDWLPESLADRDFFDIEPRSSKLGVNVPSANIHETAKEFVIEMAAPGLQRNDFQIELEEGALTISVEKEEETEEKKAENGFTRREYSYSSFSRCFTLPENIREGAIEAKYDNGILKVTIPKEKESSGKPAQNIQVK
ncbi:MAG: Hsp20/alpha crystallin family protein [Chryseosolibacter sp.]